MAGDGISQSTVQLFCSEEGWVAGVVRVGVCLY